MATATKIKERPILFSGEMVRAILDGRKTQTRRIVREQPAVGTDSWWCTVASTERGNVGSWTPRQRDKSGGHNHLQSGVSVRCPYGHSGDRLWVRETWRPLGVKCGCYEQPCDCFSVDVLYAADGAKRRFDEWTISDEWEWPKAAERGNVPGIHMPRWASRLTLEITGIRVERLGSISEADAYAEGVTIPSHQAFVSNGNPELRNEARCAFHELWESINGPGSWAANPWVWCVEFRKV